jgi:hypothetical protein
MKTRFRRTTIVVGFCCALVGFLPSAWAAMKVRRPILEKPSPAAPARRAARAQKGGLFVGTVIFIRGNQVVAEIPAGAKAGERFVLYDAGLRRGGKAVAVKPLEEGIFLLRPAGRLSGRAGDQVARESESEAVARVLRQHRLESYQEFLELFPGTIHRARIAREMFRIRMKSDYPTFPGAVIEGKVQLVESSSREISLGQVLIVLDRFIIARSDERGKFRIEGIPKLEEPVQLKMRVKDPKLLMAKSVEIDLQAGTFGEVEMALPVQLTPTVLAGRVVDHRGAPLPGVEVWTFPHSMEVLTDEQGAYRVSRRKKLGASGADEPLLGGEYEVYAFRKGYNVERTFVSAESFLENPVSPIRLVRQDPREAEVPELGLDLAAFLELSPATGPEGAGPKINR